MKFNALIFISLKEQIDDDIDELLEKIDIDELIKSPQLYLEELAKQYYEAHINLGNLYSKKKDFQFLDGSTITVYPYTEKGTLEMEIIQDDVPLYATRTLVIEMDDSLDYIRDGKILNKDCKTFFGYDYTLLNPCFVDYKDEMKRRKLCKRHNSRNSLNSRKKN